MIFFLYHCVQTPVVYKVLQKEEFVSCRVHYFTNVLCVFMDMMLFVMRKTIPAFYEQLHEESRIKTKQTFSVCPYCQKISSYRSTAFAPDPVLLEQSSSLPLRLCSLQYYWGSLCIPVTTFSVASVINSCKLSFYFQNFAELRAKMTKASNLTSQFSHLENWAFPNLPSFCQRPFVCYTWTHV